MSSLKVTPDQLQALGGSTHAASGDIRGQHQQLKHQLSPLFGADWSGAASVQFTTLYDEFDQHARGLGDALDGIAGLLQNAGANYLEAETLIAASFR